MAVTRLKRKARKNRTKSKSRLQTIKLLESKPVIRQVDVEAIKEEFKKKHATPKVKDEAPQAEVNEVATKAEEVKTDSKKKEEQITTKEKPTKPIAKKTEEKATAEKKKQAKKAAETKKKASKPTAEKAKTPAKKSVKKKDEAK